MAKKRQKTKFEHGKAKPPQPPGEEHQAWSKSKKKRMRRKKSQQKRNDGCPKAGGGATAVGRKRPAPDPIDDDDAKKGARIAKRPMVGKEVSPSSVVPKLDVGTEGGARRPRSALQRSFLARLSGSRFRELNEELYTTSSSSAFEKFSSRPELFDQYHEGFREQVKHWPSNPVDVILRWLVALQRKRRQRDGLEKEKLVVADFGCGDAKLAKELLAVRSLGGGGDEKRNNKAGDPTTVSSSSPFVVHSFDLVSRGNPLVTACDMANVSLDDGVADVGVFSLALMGTNVADFVREAHRVLRPDGILKIAEVRSRFESTAGDGDGAGDDDDDGDGPRRRRDERRKKGGGGSRRTDDRLLNEFLDAMERLGFRCTKKDRSNKMFALMEFEKNGRAPLEGVTFTVKPCIYKRR